jgi:hypothetical protein
MRTGIHWGIVLTSWSLNKTAPHCPAIVTCIVQLSDNPVAAPTRLPFAPFVAFCGKTGILCRRCSRIFFGLWTR